MDETDDQMPDLLEEDTSDVDDDLEEQVRRHQGASLGELPRP
jgi:hypothetical protein